MKPSSSSQGSRDGERRAASRMRRAIRRMTRMDGLGKDTSALYRFSHFETNLRRRLDGGFRSRGLDGAGRRGIDFCHPNPASAGPDPSPQGPGRTPSPFMGSEGA
jgi:hypothetical protein